MNKLNFVFACICSIVLSSCDPASEANVTLYANNKTEGEIKIKIINYSLNDSSSVIDVKRLDTNVKIFNYMMFEGTGFAGTGCINIYIYNPIDSTCLTLNNCSDKRETYLKYVTEKRQSSSKHKGIIQYDLDVYITINKDMLNEMTKDTVLTDSIFGLK